MEEIRNQIALVEDLNYSRHDIVLDVYSAIKIGNMAYVSVSMQRGYTGTGIAVIELTDYKASRTAFTCVGCYGHSDGEVAIYEDSNIIYAYISESTGDTRFQLAFPIK